MKKLRPIAAAGMVALMAQTAMAGEIVIPVEEGVAVDDLTVTYSCAGEDFPVRYINAGPSVSLAVFEVEGETVVAAITVAASGARYEGGRYVWWSRGLEANLFDVMEGPDAEPIARCESENP
ncbi:MAG: MliC family protein [Rhizobiaceae bacterium]